MKKRILAMVLACLMILSVVSFVGCNDEAAEEQANKIAELEAAIKELQAEDETNASNIDGVAKDQAAKVAELKAATEALQTAIDTNASNLADEVANFAAAITAVKDDAAAIETALEAVKKTADAALAKAGENATEIAALKTAIETLEGALKADLEGAVADFNSKVDEINAALELKASIAELDAAKAELLEAINGNAGDIAEAATEFNKALERVAALEATDATLATQEALDAVKATADAALAKAEALEDIGDIDELLTTLANVKTLTASLQGDVEGLKETVSNLQTSVSKILEDLKGKISVQDWNDATEVVIETMAKLEKAFASYTKDYYPEATWNLIVEDHELAKIRITRALDTTSLGKIVDDFVVTANAYKTNAQLLEIHLEDINKELVALNDYYVAKDGKSLLLSEGVADRLDNVRKNLDGANTELTRISNGVLAPEEAAKALAEAYDALDATHDKYVARVTALEAAQKAAADINETLIPELEKCVAAGKIVYDATMSFKKVNDEIVAWEELYFQGELADEITNKSANYMMIKRDAYGDYVEAYEALVEAEIASMGTNLESVKANYEATEGKSLLDEGVVAVLDAVKASYALVNDNYFAVYTAGDSAIEKTAFDGYKATLDLYVAREAALQAAKTEAEAINALVVEYTAEVSAEGYEVNADMTANLEALEARIATWKTTYFSDIYAAEEVNKSANYTKVEHEDFETLKATYYNLGKEARELLEAFAKSLAALDKITLLSKPALDESKALYDAYTAICKADGTTLNHEYDGHDGAYYLNIWLTKSTEYDAWVKEAQEAYDKANAEGLTTSTVDIYDEAAVAEMLAWYRDYGVWENETLVFGEGYPVVDAESKKVNEGTYNAALAVEAAHKALVEAKKAETANVNELLAAIANAGAVTGEYPSYRTLACTTHTPDQANCEKCGGTQIDFSANKIELSDRKTIEDARAAYEAWLNGSGCPEGYNEDQYKIDDSINADFADYQIVADDYTNLTKAEYYLNFVTNMRTGVVQYIATLDATNPTANALNTAKARIAILTKANCGDEACLDDEHYAAIAAYELALHKKNKLAEIEPLYTEMLGKLGDATLENLDDATAAFKNSYTTVCDKINDAASEGEVNDLVAVWTNNGGYAVAKAAWELAVAKRDAKADVEVSYNTKLAEYTNETTKSNFTKLYDMTIEAIDAATDIAAVNTAVSQWENTYLKLYPSEI